MFSFFKKRTRDDSVESHGTIYAIGDIQGCTDELNALLNKINDHLKSESRYQIIFLGNYIDNGPHSKAVIERLLQFRAAFPTSLFLKGLHEASLIQFLENAAFGPIWFQHGAAATLRSYDVEPPAVSTNLDDWEDCRMQLIKAMPNAHKEFFYRLDPFATIGHYFFASGAVNPLKELSEQNPSDFLYSSDAFVRSNRKYDKIIVHGYYPESSAHFDDRRIGTNADVHKTKELVAAKIKNNDVEFINTLKH